MANYSLYVKQIVTKDEYYKTNNSPIRANLLH